MGLRKQSRGQKKLAYFPYFKMENGKLGYNLLLGFFPVPTSMDVHNGAWCSIMFVNRTP